MAARPRRWQVGMTTEQYSAPSSSPPRDLLPPAIIRVAQRTNRDNRRESWRGDQRRRPIH
jgi:hypothetical protein